MKYLFIFEDGTMWTSDECTDQDKHSNSEGILTIVRLTDRCEFFEGKWLPIERK